MFSSVFQALGNGLFSLITSVCRQLAVLLPAAYLLARTGRLELVWWAFVISGVVSFALSLCFMIHINRTVLAPLSAAPVKPQGR